MAGSMLPQDASRMLLLQALNNTYINTLLTINNY
jgi:hypothetical protein